MKISILLFLALVLNARAQYDLSFWTADASGGTQSSANYIINSTTGQNDVGSTLPGSANYRIIPGFWAVASIPPATVVAQPELSITLDGPNVILSWPSPASGFVLQQADSLSVHPVVWVNSPGLVSDDGFMKSLAIPPNEFMKFYRLRKP